MYQPTFIHSFCLPYVSVCVRKLCGMWRVSGDWKQNNLTPSLLGGLGSISYRARGLVHPPPPIQNSFVLQTSISVSHFIIWTDVLPSSISLEEDS